MPPAAPITAPIPVARPSMPNQRSTSQPRKPHTAIPARRYPRAAQPVLAPCASSRRGDWLSAMSREPYQARSGSCESTPASALAGVETTTSASQAGNPSHYSRASVWRLPCLGYLGSQNVTTVVDPSDYGGGGVCEGTPRDPGDRAGRGLSGQPSRGQ